MFLTNFGYGHGKICPGKIQESSSPPVENASDRELNQGKRRPRLCVLRPRICGPITLTILLRTDGGQPIPQPSRAVTQPHQASRGSLSQRISILQSKQPLPKPSVPTPIQPTTMKRPVGRPRKKQRSLDPVYDKCMEDYMLGCCEKKCLWDFGFNSVVSYHTWYAQKSQEEALDWLAAACMNWWIPLPDGSSAIQARIAGNTLCELGLCRLYGFSTSKLQAAKEKDPTSSPLSRHVSNQNAAQTTMQDNIYTWCKEFFDAFGDQLPNSPQVHMPSFCTIKSLYTTYVSDMNASKMPPRAIGSESSFRNFIDKHFQHVRFPRKTRLGRCDFCTSIHARRMRCTTEEEKNQLSKEIELHQEITSAERRSYHERRDYALRHPTKIASIIIDGSEKIKLPNIVPIPKQLARANILELGVIGTICHNMDKKFIYLTVPDFPKGADLNISVLYWQIYQMLSSYSDNQRPSILLLQVDNGSENKNRWMFGFLSMLIEWEWFVEVNLYFLQPGHTHEDVDQMFSGISTHLDTHTIGSIPSLISSLSTNAKTIPPSVSVLSSYMHWSSWLAPHLKDFSGHGESYAFIFRKLPNGRPGMKMKLLATSTYWQGLTSSPEEWVELFSSIPTGAPQLIKHQNIDPSSISDLHKFESWLSTFDSNWLTHVQDRHRIQNIPEPPNNWTDFSQFKLPAMAAIDTVQIQDMLGNGPNSFVIRGSNSLSHISIGTFTLQETPFQPGQMVALYPSASSTDLFWLGQVVEVLNSNDIKYKIHYWVQKKNNNQVWQPHRGIGSYGTATHSAIIFGPITLTSQNSVPANCLRHIKDLLKEE